MILLNHSYFLDDESNPTKLKSKQPKKLINVNKPKSCKRGIVYLGYIPDGLNVKTVRVLLSRFGEIDRIFLEKDKSPTKNKASKRAKFVEGWVEFKKKSVAKLVAQTLNGTIIGGKRRSPYYGSLWNLKYLKRYFPLMTILAY